jgi:hypothetical protein
MTEALLVDLKIKALNALRQAEVFVGEKSGFETWAAEAERYISLIELHTRLELSNVLSELDKMTLLLEKTKRDLRVRYK